MKGKDLKDEKASGAMEQNVGKFQLLAEPNRKEKNVIDRKKKECLIGNVYNKKASAIVFKKECLP